MEFIRENAMSNEILNSKRLSIEIDNSTISLSTWTKKGSENINSVISICTGDAHWQANLDTNKSQALIDLLHLHIANIKANELEILALQTKAAA
jgi:hypothetical protein